LPEGYLSESVVLKVIKIGKPPAMLGRHPEFDVSGKNEQAPDREPLQSFTSGVFNGYSRKLESYKVGL
jgi:hypothetical protein